jgi:hypothetical protein
MIKEDFNMKRFQIFTAIDKERKRQEEKWGVQNHPVLDIPFTIEGMLKGQRTYKQLNDSGEDCSWFMILMEEVYEAFSETDPVKQREEMIQVAAVAVQIIEYLKRRTEALNYDGKSD